MQAYGTEMPFPIQTQEYKSIGISFFILSVIKNWGFSHKQEAALKSYIIFLLSFSTGDSLHLKITPIFWSQ